MKKLTKHFCLLLFAVTLLSSCNSDTRLKLIGEWKEHWGIGSQTDVNYSDTVKIQLTTDGDLIMSCPNYEHYLFDKIVYDGKEFSFRMENTSVPNEKFYVFYKLTLQDNGKWMDGSIENSRNKKVSIKWEKIH